MQGFPEKTSSDIRQKKAFKSSFLVNVEADFMWLILELPLITVQSMEARAQISGKNSLKG